MGQDLKKLFENAPTLETQKLLSGHKARFEDRLEEELPIAKKTSFSLLKIAASVAIVVSLTVSGFLFLNNGNSQGIAGNDDSPKKINSMADISPDLKKMEDFYLNHINYQMSKIKMTDENKVILTTYLAQLGELQKEYDNTIASLEGDEVSEETIDALINNLQSRLKLMYQLKAQLKTLENLNTQRNEDIKA